MQTESTLTHAHTLMSFDDGNIPDIDLPGGGSRATDVIPDEVPRQDGPDGDATNVIPDEVPRQDGPGGEPSEREIRL